MSLALRLPRNTAGRDFIVGDIHGCFERASELIAKVGTSGKIAFMDVGDDIRASQAEQLVVSFDVFGEIFETITLATGACVTLAPVLRLAQFEALDHGAHGAIQYGNAIGQNARQCLTTGIG